MIPNNTHSSAPDRGVGKLILFLSLTAVLELAVIIGLLSGIALFALDSPAAHVIVTGGGSFVAATSIGFAIVQMFRGR